MKKLIQLLVKLLTKEKVAKSCIFSLMGISQIDTTSFFYNIYNFSAQSISLSVLLVTYFIIIYWTKTSTLKVDNKCRKRIMVLKTIVFLFLILPIFVNYDLDIITWVNLDTCRVVRAIIELAKIIFIEVMIDVYANWIK
jgi:hypothetical protein